MALEPATHVSYSSSPLSYQIGIGLEGMFYKQQEPMLYSRATEGGMVLSVEPSKEIHFK